MIVTKGSATKSLRAARKRARNELTNARRGSFTKRRIAIRRLFHASPKASLWLFRLPSRVERTLPTKRLTVDPAHIIDGDVGGLRPSVWADLVDDYRFGSRRFPNWPHLCDPSSTDGIEFASEVRKITGTSNSSSRIPTASTTVRKVAGRPGFYHVVDGHKRLLEAHKSSPAGKVEVRVVRGVPSQAPLDRLLKSMSWMSGESAVYQPVPSQFLESDDRVIRDCVDRFDKMTDALKEFEVHSYLDVGACYGYFVWRFGQLGLDSSGIELDSLAPEAGHALYSLAREQICVGDARKLIRETERRDVVSCFSLIHHFWMQDQSEALTFLTDLWDRTEVALFMDSGHAGEKWLRDLGAPTELEFETALRSLPDSIVTPLGRDQDGGGANGENYGRQLYIVERASH